MALEKGQPRTAIDLDRAEINKLSKFEVDDLVKKSKFMYEKRKKEGASAGELAPIGWAIEQLTERQKELDEKHARRMEAMKDVRG